MGFWASQNLNPPSRFPGAPAPWRDASQLQPGSLGRLSDRAVPVLAPRFSGQSRDNGSKELLGQRRHTLREAGRHRHGAHSLHLGAGGEKEGRKGGHQRSESVKCTFRELGEKTRTTEVFPGVPDAYVLMVYGG